jgi:hypothetical protein
VLNYKLNFIISMYRKNSILIGSVPSLAKASMGVMEHVPLQQGDYCTSRPEGKVTD